MPSCPATNNARSASRSSEVDVKVELIDALGDTGKAMAIERGEGDREVGFPRSFFACRISLSESLMELANGRRLRR